jgi:hypothetical protein
MSPACAPRRHVSWRQHLRSFYKYAFVLTASERETAEALGVSMSTMKRDWQFAKALFEQLTI